MSFFYVFIGGGSGSLIRYSIGLLFQKTNLNLPIATLISNCIACLIFAYSLSFIESKEDSQSTFKLLILTGFCGGLSTFSTFGYETFLLVKQGNSTWALINIFASVLLCVGSYFLVKR